MNDPNDTFSLGQYAERAYLEYAMSVVKGRALPDVADGQKPVQRRILFAMHDMRLMATSKPVKSARVVGEILGKYHPHGDASAYEALVRMAQDFTLRYPLIDGIGNFGSRDGDGAAAMRYTEARLTPFAALLLDEIHQGTVDFVANYDGSFQEPTILPARLPMLLLNGASGIAVGMATEIPPHNLTEVAQAAVALLKNPDLTLSDIMRFIPAPDFPGGGQIITPQATIEEIYRQGRGSLRLRARYEIEKLARGQWRVIVTELPPNVSTQKIMQQIEDITGPVVRAGRKSLTQEQQNNRNLMLSILDRVRDESDAESPVRLVFEPKSSRQNADEFMTTLLAQTDLEINVAINLVMMGRNNRPAQKDLLTILQEWLDFRIETVTRRLQYRLTEAEKRIHILQGRMTVFLHIDEVIAVIRESDEPKPELMQRFGLSAIQAEDILEIRLRQLARLEWIKLEKELQNLEKEAAELKHLLDHEHAKKQKIIKEILADAKTYGDARRTLLQEADRAILSQTLADEPISIILSREGWIRSRQGHGLDLSQTTFKEGDELFQVLETRSVLPIILWDSQGRSYRIDVADIPGGRGMGVPLTSLIDWSTDAKMVAMLSGEEDDLYLLSSSSGYGFICRLADMASRLKAGKSILTLTAGEYALMPVAVPPTFRQPEERPLYLVAVNTDHRLLAFPLHELRQMARGRGLQIMAMSKDAALIQLMITDKPYYFLHSQGARGALYRDRLRLEDIVNKRAHRGKVVKTSAKMLGLEEDTNA